MGAVIPGIVLAVGAAGATTAAAEGTRRSMKPGEIDMPNFNFPDVDDEDADRSASAAAAGTRSRYNKRRGRGATILTSGLGVTGPARVGMKTLTGG